MFDSEQKEPLCIVDLDTVMPGLVLFDFGDSVVLARTDCAEDRRFNKSKLRFRLIQRKHTWEALLKEQTA